MTNCELCDPEYVIKEYDHWLLAVSYAQPTLGKLLAVTKRHVPDYDKLTAEEHIEYLKVYRDACRLLRNVFGADMVNFAYMNNKSDCEKHVHTHIIGRYAEQPKFAGRTWVDENYGEQTPFYGKQTPFDSLREDQKIIDGILRVYKEELSKWEINGI